MEVKIGIQNVAREVVIEATGSEADIESAVTMNFMKAAASCLRAPEVPTKASWPAMTAYLLGAVTKSWPERVAISLATATA